MTHESKIPDAILDRIMARRGKLHIYDEIEASRTALLVVDMQNAFVDADMPSAVKYASGIVPNINRLAAGMRDAGATVVWIQNTFTPESLEDWSVFFEGFYTPDRRDAVLASLLEDTEGHELWPGLEPAEGDWHVRKDRFSAFIQGASDLEARLREAGIDMVVIVGTLTNVCSESTARDAMMRNFRVIMVSDANATHSDIDHNAALGSIFQVFGDVMTVDEVVERLKPVAAITEELAAAAS
jgi:ureidoacrylate peracid hydrolase